MITNINSLTNKEGISSPKSILFKGKRQIIKKRTKKNVKKSNE